MPYAVEGRISEQPLVGGISITRAEYVRAMEGMLNGLAVTIGADSKLALVNPHQPPAVPEPTPEELAAQALEARKAQRAQAVAAIKVVVGEHEFDGDEISQGRMARAIVGLHAQPGATVQWVLADNRVVAVAVDELTQALTLAGLAQTALWVIK